MQLKKLQPVINLKGNTTIKLQKLEELFSQSETGMKGS